MQWTPNGVYVCVLNRYHNMINCESYFCSLIQEQPVDRAVESTSKWRHWYFPFFGGLRLPGVISPKSGLQACMRARKSKQAKKPARKQASQPASKQASNEQPASEQASKKGKKKKASKQPSQYVIRTQMDTVLHDCLRNLWGSCDQKTLLPSFVSAQFCLWHSSFNKPPGYEWLLPFLCPLSWALSTSRHGQGSSPLIAMLIGKLPTAALITTHWGGCHRHCIATAFAL